MKKNPFLVTAALLFAAVGGYLLSYWLVIATHRFGGARIVSLSVSEFFTYRLAFALMLFFCGLLAVLAAWLAARLCEKDFSVGSFFGAFSVIAGCASIAVVIRFFVLKNIASSLPVEQRFLFLSSLNYALWGMAAALVSFAFLIIARAVKNALSKK